ncbi:hypothetical protein [Agrobacterium salinitolerans]|uniref:Uncharacterized protein n=1 Tax=Agrobacterium salinitolerans TaxID=1183413 RepID=A0A9X3QXG7_9HYPH|nr:hypothetical protein [Agrobacterium salinitolerans]MCZ7936681.1 hypothetical protein [Agrobacterium salinitolerans]
MINHGTWNKYTPPALPQSAPFNAIFWQRDSDDWYVWSRNKWNIVQGIDPSKTIKVAVNGDRVISVETDATYLTLPTSFTLFELPEDADKPKPGWLYERGEFKNLEDSDQETE